MSQMENSKKEQGPEAISLTPEEIDIMRMGLSKLKNLYQEQIEDASNLEEQVKVREETEARQKLELIKQLIDKLSK